jgi:hypothetical protein
MAGAAERLRVVLVGQDEEQVGGPDRHACDFPPWAGSA